MRVLSDAVVKANDRIAPGHHRLLLRAPELAHAAKAGQFCMVLVSENLFPFLRRPLCFERIHPQSEEISLLFKIEGNGTRMLSQVQPGQKLSLQGPLGNGFPIDSSWKRHIIVSGGIGVATFPALADALTKICPAPPEVILAARSKDLLLCKQEFRALGCTVHLATDDGSVGEKAFASQMLERLSPGPDTRVYACGPMIMMQTVSRVALKANANCLVSLEAQMACGDGACLGCVVESKQELEGEKMVRVCVDGPVFDTAIIDWESHNTAYDV